MTSALEELKIKFQTTNPYQIQIKLLNRVEAIEKSLSELLRGIKDATPKENPINAIKKRGRPKKHG